ncbi:MAG: hypothetical protein JSR42_11750 [Proteobacteria bacterium]|nr:hypothetical protein [Pseudomonadota bacterium]MBS0555036.1 hypothetical protein [Pseudomonadota bacterium]
MRTAFASARAISEMGKCGPDCRIPGVFDEAGLLAANELAKAPSDSTVFISAEIAALDFDPGVVESRQRHGDRFRIE